MTITWTESPGAVGYHIFRDGSLIKTIFAPASSTIDRPNDTLTHAYCIEAYNVSGSSQCCVDGGQATLPTPVCTLTARPFLNILSWNAVPAAAFYAVHRDGSLLANTTQLTYQDSSPLSGTHEYCVQALAGGVHSDSCCQSVATLPGTPVCTCSSDQRGVILVRWTDDANETGYRLYRDSQLRAQLAANETTYADSTLGRHVYCVEAFNDVGISDRGCNDGTGVAFTAIPIRLSWGTCSPQLPDQHFAGPGVYTLVLSSPGAPQAIIGHDTHFTVLAPVPDAWRFDDAGCQGSLRLHLSNDGLSGCPSMLGSNPLTITDYSFNAVNGTCELRLAITFDDLSTDPQQRYVLWTIGFDHDHSAVGTDADPSTCDGADLQVRFNATTEFLLTNGYTIDGALSSGDAPVTWNGTPVKTTPMTWGRLKSLYRR